MATSNNDRGSRIIKVGEGNELRKVEKDVLIPKIMKEKAMQRCSEYVQGTDSNTQIIFLKRSVLMRFSVCLIKPHIYSQYNLTPKSSCNVDMFLIFDVKIF